MIEKQKNKTHLSTSSQFSGIASDQFVLVIHTRIGIHETAESAAMKKRLKLVTLKTVKQKNMQIYFKKSPLVIFC